MYIRVVWFSSLPLSMIFLFDRHDIAEILLKVALNTQKSINQSIYLNFETVPKVWYFYLYFIL